MTCKGCEKRREILARIAKRLWRKGAIRMDFETWVTKHDFWKSDAKDACRHAWAQMLRCGMHVNDVADILDRIVAGMKNEYGD